MELNLGFPGCCDLVKSRNCFIIDCHCDQACHFHNDCCDDIADIGCSPASPSPIVTSTPTGTLGKTNQKIIQNISHNLEKTALFTE